MLLGPSQERHVAPRRIADAKLLADFPFKVARLQVGARRLRLLRLQQASPEERRQLRMKRVKARALPRLGVLLFRNLDPALLRELLHRVDEFQPLVLLDEREH